MTLFSGVGWYLANILNFSPELVMFFLIVFLASIFFSINNEDIKISINDFWQLSPFTSCFLIFCLVSASFSIDSWRSLTTLFLSFFAFICLFVYCQKESSYEKNILYVLFAILTFYMFLFGYEYINLGVDKSIKLDGRFRLSTGIPGRTNPNTLMNFVAPVSLAALCVGIFNGFNTVKYWLVIWTFAVGYFIVGLTYSYTGLIGCFLSFLVVLIVKPATRTYVMVFLAFSALFLGFILALEWSHESTLKTATIGIRWGIWQNFIELWNKKPILGYGMAKDISVFSESANHGIVLYKYAHSIFVHTLVQGGLVGFGLFLLAIIEQIRKALQLAFQGKVFPLALLMLVAPMAMFQKGPLLNLNGHTWMIIWLPMFVIFRYSQKNYKKQVSLKN